MPIGTNNWDVERYNNRLENYMYYFYFQKLVNVSSSQIFSSQNINIKLPDCIIIIINIEEKSFNEFKKFPWN